MNNHTNMKEYLSYAQIVRHTWQERFDMYMKCSKKKLASMMAERDKYMFPELCKEFESKTDEGTSSQTTYTATT